MGKRTRIILIALAAIFVIIQLIPVERANPPVVSDLEAPPPVKDVLKRACYDCHSNETKWPWYSYVAPVSWLIAHHVEEGREHLNFSTWGQMGAERRRHKAHEIREEVEAGKMPLPIYLFAHPDAALDDGEKARIGEWSASISGGESRHHEDHDPHEDHDH